MKKIITILMATVVVSIVILNIPGIVESSLPKTSITRVQHVDYVDNVSAKGEVSKKNSQSIKSETPLVVSEVFVSEGDIITSGQTIITVDRAATAKKIIETNQYSALSALGLDTSMTGYDSVIGMIPEKIASNVDGTIEKIGVSSGDYIEENTTIATFLGSDGLIINAPISENYISKIAVGQSVVITGNGFNKKYSGVVEEIANEATKEYVGTTQDTVVYVKIRFTDADDEIKTGYTAKVKILTSEEKTIPIVPYEAVMEDEENKEYVYVFNNGLAVRKDIKTGIELGEGVEILSGITEEETILITSDDVKEGKYVKVVE